MAVDDRKDRHSVVINRREGASVSEVYGVDSFDENEIVLSTSMGALSFYGSELKINKFDAQTGELFIEGHIDEAVYGDGDVNDKRTLFSRIFG